MKQLEKLITESVNNSLQEMKLKAIIKTMLREYIENEYGTDENKSDKKKKSDKDKKSDKKKHDSKKDKDDDDNSDVDSPKTEELISSIEDYFSNPAIKQAPFAYKLYGVEPIEGDDTDEMKNARKKFSAKVNHELNDSGYPYQFDGSEAVAIKGMISAQNLDLNESKKSNDLNFTPEEALELKKQITKEELNKVRNWEKRMDDATNYNE